MAIFKCKMCGGDLTVDNNMSVCECDYCGSKQTLPRLNDDKISNLYERANHFRRNNEYDKAIDIYEDILTEDTTDAEAYWSLVLCKYGIEYVEDPATHKRVPTVNRAQYTSIFSDENYKSAIKYADSYQKSIYEEEAAVIDKIQKDILDISKNEKPFDVFICYKETALDGTRSYDSVVAMELYNELVKAGFKVFFARVTLEDKLGTAYEPYIFAALNSAKVMTVIGTKKEHFEAVWVKNEWSRYLALIKDGAKKTLIPVYKDMEAYDLPPEFSHLQAQDMNKLGFLQDLIRGITKIVSPEKLSSNVSSSSGAQSATIDSYCKRIFMFLEDSDWNKANEYCERVLDIDPENAIAYLGRLMAYLEITNRENLKDCENPFENNADYQKIIKFGDSEFVDEIKGYNQFIIDRNKLASDNAKYNKACSLMYNAEKESQFGDALNIFKSLDDFKDSKAKIDECISLKNAFLNDRQIESAKGKMSFDNIENYNYAITILSKLNGWKNSAELIEECNEKIAEIKAAEEKANREAEQARIEKERQEMLERKKAKNKKTAKIIIIMLIPVIVVCSIFGISKYVEHRKAVKYEAAVSLLEQKKYSESYEMFKELKDYSDSAKKGGEIASNHLEVLNVGEVFEFGKYKDKPITWIVLEKKKDKILVISENVLLGKKFNETKTSTSWANCDLRGWLNNSFYNSSFSKDQKKKIKVNENMKTGKNPLYHTSSGSDTNDKIYVLTASQIDNYFSSNYRRKCTNRSGEPSGYWTRTSGEKKDKAAYVNVDGDIKYHGDSVNKKHGIRPAMWLKTK